MSVELNSGADAPQGSTRQMRTWAVYLTKAENLVVALALAIMLVLPLAEAFLRRTLHVSIPGSVSVVQHMVLIVGMLGGAIAARENRLLALSNLADTHLRGKWKDGARMFTSALGAVICILLAVAAFQFAWAERESGSILAYGIPTWAVQLVLPFGFALVGIRILWNSSEKARLRLATLLLAVLVLVVLWGFPVGGNHQVIAALSLTVVASVLGVPAFVTLGGVALVLFWSVGQPIASIPIAHYALVTNPTLPTLPLFTLAGYFLTEGGAPKRLVRVFYALFGQFRGGAAIVTVLVCAFFTSFTGASGVTILALGGLLMP